MCLYTCVCPEHTPTKPHAAYRSFSCCPIFFTDTNTQLYLCLLRCLSPSPFSGLMGGLTIKLLVQSLTAHNLGQPVLRPNLADIVGTLVYPPPLASTLPSVKQQQQLRKEWRQRLSHCGRPARLAWATPTPVTPSCPLPSSAEWLWRRKRSLVLFIYIRLFVQSGKLIPSWLVSVYLEKVFRRPWLAV